MGLLIVQTTFTVVGAIAGMIAVRNRLRFDWAPRVFFGALIVVVIATGILDFYTRFNQYAGESASIESTKTDWPLLSGANIEEWANTLRPIKVENAGLAIYYAKRDEDVAVGIGEAIEQAGWPRPSLIGDQVPLGISITARPEMAQAASALQALCQKQFDVRPEITLTGQAEFFVLYIGRRSDR